MNHHRQSTDPQRGDLGAATAPEGKIPKLFIPLDPTQTSGSALRTILLRLLESIESNVEGTIDDLGEESLHDLRVAVRRTRSALGQLKGVLPRDQITPFKTEFKWLGELTGPLRDLDVFLLAMPDFHAAMQSDPTGEYEALEAHVGHVRAAAHREVAHALSSDRFSRLVEGWRRILESVEYASAPDAARPVGELSAQCISRAFRKVLTRGGKLGDDLPSESMHRLRIDAKKLRYLLEFFRSLYPERAISIRIRELKRLQDILGGFNDAEVQRDLLSSFGREFHTDPSTGRSRGLALGRLVDTLEQRQEAHRLAFQDAFVEFSGMPVRAAYGHLFGGRESSQQA